MSNKSDLFLKKTVGDDFLESLVKFDLYKPETRSVVSHEEMGTALQIVPRVLMAFLIKNLAPIEVNGNKQFDLPVGEEVRLEVTKHERDVYSGRILEKNKVIVDFKYRTIPGIGLLILSTFELYEVADLTAASEVAAQPDVTAQVNKMIEERMALHSMINAVVDKKMSERDAIQVLALARMTQQIQQPSVSHLPVHAAIEEIPEVTHEDLQEVQAKKKPGIVSFMEKREHKKLKKSEFSIVLAKGETVDCPDCKKPIFNETIFSACVCFGESKKVHLKKSADGVKISFPAGWDPEDIQMLLEILWRKNGRSNV